MVLKKEILVSVILSASIIEETIRAIALYYNINSPIISIIDLSIYVVFGLYLLLFCKFNEKQLLFERTFFLLILLCIIFFTTIGTYKNAFMHSFVYYGIINILFFFIGQLEVDTEIIVKHCRFCVWLSIVYASVYIFFIKKSGYYMTLTYNILPWSILSYIEFVKNRKFHYFVAFIALTTMTFIGGARMPLVCIIIFVILSSFYRRDKLTKNRILVFLFLTAAIIIGITFYRNILMFLSNILPESRTIQMLLNEDVLSVSYRDNIYEYIMQVVYKNPFKIRGFYADRIILGTRFFNNNDLGFWITDSSHYTVYAHNIFIELLSNFGFMIGTIVIIFIAKKILVLSNFAWNDNNYYNKMYCLFLIVVGLIPLLVSNSYMQYSMFWYFIGYADSLKFQKCRKRSAIICC